MFYMFYIYRSIIIKILLIIYKYTTEHNYIKNSKLSFGEYDFESILHYKIGNTITLVKG